MLQQADDFRQESDALFALLDGLSESDWETKTQFKDWTINDVVAHLHYWNQGADLSLHDEKALTELMADLATAWQGEGHIKFTHRRLGHIKGRVLLEAWRDFYQEMADRFAIKDPRRRVKWAGPDMSVRSSITARLMETWAHGQAVYDIFGRVRDDKDRVKNIVVIGVNTFGWTFANRGMDVPAEMPYVGLKAPSGALWEWGTNGTEKTAENSILGSATEFCQVVTQVRNIADTALEVKGPVATQWMDLAQCFAGAPEDPPAAGTRFRAT